MSDSKQLNTEMPSDEPNHPTKDAEKPDAGKKDRMGEDDEEDEGADTSVG